MKKCLCGVTLLLLAASLALADETADANALFQKQDWPAAAAAYRALTQAHPQSGLSWFRLGTALHETGDYPAALDALQRAVAAQFPAKGPLHFQLVRTYARLGDREHALAELDQLAAFGFMQLAKLDSDPDLAGLRGDAHFAEIRRKVAHNAAPCVDTPEYHQFDFWIGEWDVDAAGTPVGASSIQQILGQCVILENWTGNGGYTGKSFNIFDQNAKKWRQFWVDAKGGMLEFEGDYSDKKLVYHADIVQPDGSHKLRRLTFFDLGPGHVRQFSEMSSDGGKTWATEYDFNYVRKTG